MTDAKSEANLPKINERHKRFVMAYVTHWSGKRAAADAGYSGNNLEVQASKLLARPEVKAWIRFYQERYWQSSIMTKDELLSLLSEQARNPLPHLMKFTADGDPVIDLADAPTWALGHVAEVTVEDYVDARETDEEGNAIKRETKRVKLKMVSPDAARDKLAKHLKLYDAGDVGSALVNFAAELVAAGERVRNGKKDLPQNGD